MTNAFEDAAKVVGELGSIARSANEVVSAVGGAREQMEATAREMQSAHGQVLEARASILDVKNDVMRGLAESKEATRRIQARLTWVYALVVVTLVLAASGAVMALLVLLRRG